MIGAGLRILVLCIVGAAILPGAARALIVAGSVETPGRIRDIALADGVAYLVTGQPTAIRSRSNNPEDYGVSSLRVIDASNPKAPAEIASLEIEGALAGIEVAGGVAYLAAGIAGLRLIDVSDPADPVEIGAIDTPENPSASVEAVTVVGAIAYLARAEAGLQLIDVSDPTAPAVIASIDTPGYARGVAVAGRCAYVADSEAGLRVIDVSNPQLPVEIGSLDTGGDAKRLVVVGDLAYVVGSGFGLRIIDVSDPASPVAVGALDAFPIANDIAVVDDVAYLVASTLVLAGELQRGGLLAIDVSDPAQPRELGSLSAAGEAIAVAGHFAHVGSGALDAGAGSLWVIDLSHPETPAELGAIERPGARDVEVEAGIAYLATGSRLEVIDASDATAPVPIAGVELPDGANQIAKLDAHTYVVAGSFGLAAVDVAIAEAPHVLGTLDSADLIAGIAVAGDLVYAISWNDPCEVVNQGEGYRCVRGTRVGFSDTLQSGFIEPSASYSSWPYASNTSIYDSLQPLPDSWKIREDGGSTGEGISYLDIGSLVVWGEPIRPLGPPSHLHVIDFSDRAAPVEIGALEFAGEAAGVAVEGTSVYVAAGTAGLRVIDVSDATAPLELASLDLAYHTASDVAVVDRIAYLVGPGYGLTLVDVSNPASPLVIGAHGGGASLGWGSLRIANGLVYLTGPFATALLDASNPQQISTLGALFVPASGIAVADGLAYFAGGRDVASPGLSTALRIFDLGREYLLSIEVELDVQPESREKSIHLGSRGLVSVAILGAEDLDVEQIDPATLAFGSGAARPVHRGGGHLRDVDRDGFADWVSHFRIPETGITSDQPEACISGKLLDGPAFEGCQSIQTRN